MFVFSQHLADGKELIARRDTIKENLKNFYKTNYASFEGRNVNRSIMEERNRLLEVFLSDELAQ